MNDSLPIGIKIGIKMLTLKMRNYVCGLTSSVPSIERVLSELEFYYQLTDMTQSHNNYY